MYSNPASLKYLKGQCHEIVEHIFLAEKIRPRPHMYRQKRFCELFRFCKDIRSQSLKIAGSHSLTVNFPSDMGISHFPRDTLPLEQAVSDTVPLNGPAHEEC